MNEVLPPGIRRSRAVPETLVRIVSYSATRLVALFLTVVVGVYLTILVANMGGYVDVIKRAEIREGAIFRVLADPKMMRLPSDERARRIEEMIRLDLPGPLAFAAIRQHAGPRRDCAGAHVGRSGLVLWHLSDPDFRRAPAPVAVWWHDRCAAAAAARGVRAECPPAHGPADRGH